MKKQVLGALLGLSLILCLLTAVVLEAGGLPAGGHGAAPVLLAGTEELGPEQPETGGAEEPEPPGTSETEEPGTEEPEPEEPEPQSTCKEGCSLKEGHTGECVLYDAGWQNEKDGPWQYGSLKSALSFVQEGGTVKLLKDFYITGQTGIPSITKPITLTSADPEYPCKLTCAINGHPTLLMISSDACLRDIIIDGGTDLVANGPLVLVQGGNLTLGTGASIQNNRNMNNSKGTNWLGGGVFLSGTMTMEPGSSIKNCSAWAGGGVAVVNRDDSCLTMEGGSIENCESYQGGGVCMMRGSFMMRGGEVKNCRAVMPGNPEQIKNTDIESPGEGGGVFLAWSNCSMEMSGGSITGNSAKHGGGIGCDYGNLTVSGGSVTENHAEQFGGGILASPYLKISLSGKFLIADNTSGKKGYENLYLDGNEDAGPDITAPFTVSSPVESDINLGLARWLHPDKDDPDHPERINRIVAVPGGNYTITEADRDHFISDDPKYVVRLIEEEGVKKLVLTFPTVTYRDGLNSAVFADETYLCTGGDLTPKFTGTPEREGYTFTGWKPEVTATVTGDTVYTAQWKEIPKYTVTYQDGVSGTAFGDQKTTGLLAGDPTPKFTGTPEREGYTFTGWEPEVTATVTGDTVYTAQWKEIPKYTVTYQDGVGGTAFSDQKTTGLPAGAPTPKFTGTPEREGYTFTGWKPGVEDTVTGDATYTAQWEKKPDPKPPDPPAPSGGGGGSYDDDDDDDDDDSPKRPDPGPGTKPPQDPDTEPSTDPGTEPSTDPGTEPSTDPGTEPSPDPGTSPTPDPGTEPAPGPGEELPPEPGTELPQDPDTEPEPEPEPEPQPKPEPDPVPRTGDPTHTALWAGCALASLAGIFLVLRPRRRRR